jgi:hypothetical protein
MRFAAVTMPKTEPQRSPAAEFARRLVSAAQKQAVASAQSPKPEPPADLDQRVRLAGEW